MSMGIGVVEPAITEGLIGKGRVWGLWRLEVTIFEKGIVAAKVIQPEPLIVVIENAAIIRVVITGKVRDIIASLVRSCEVVLLCLTLIGQHMHPDTILDNRPFGAVEIDGGAWLLSGVGDGVPVTVTPTED